MRLLRAVLLVLAFCGCDDTSESEPPDPPEIEHCDDGKIALPDGSCAQPGVPSDGCAEGFIWYEPGGCEPRLPSEPCPSGQLAIPGDEHCREISPCPEERWGGIPVESSTQYVDASYTGGSSDGTAMRPWTTVQQGIDAADAGDLVAVAAGTYAESVLVEKRVRLWGVCPSQVTIAAPVGSEAAIQIEAGADAAELRNLGLTGAAWGLLALGSSVSAQGLWIRDTGRPGMQLENIFGETQLAVHGSLIERCAIAGAIVASAELVLTDSVIRDSFAIPSFVGRGIEVQPHPGAPAPSRLTIERSVIERNGDSGIFVSGTDLALSESVVRLQMPNESGLYGNGVAVAADPQGNIATSARVQQCVLERNYDAGLVTLGAFAAVERSVLRDNWVSPEVPIGASGARATPDLATTTRPELTVGESLIEHHAGLGIFVQGGGYHVERTLIRDTTAHPRTHLAGEGFHAQMDSTGSLRAVLIERSQKFGVAVISSSALLEGVVVRDTTIDPAAEVPFGDGIAALTDDSTRAIVELAGCHIDRSARAGIAAFGARIEMTDTTLDCNAIDINGETFGGFPLELNDHGGNSCGCGPVAEACQIVSTGLVPPDPL